MKPMRIPILSMPTAPRLPVSWMQTASRFLTIPRYTAAYMAGRASISMLSIPTEIKGSPAGWTTCRSSVTGSRWAAGHVRRMTLRTETGMMRISCHDQINRNMAAGWRGTGICLFPAALKAVKGAGGSGVYQYWHRVVFVCGFIQMRRLPVCLIPGFWHPSVRIQRGWWGCACGWLMPGGGDSSGYRGGALGWFCHQVELQ